MDAAPGLPFLAPSGFPDFPALTPAAAREAAAKLAVRVVAELTR